jgi:hypothetical protein
MAAGEVAAHVPYLHESMEDVLLKNQISVMQRI